ncbi:MAG: gamma carbonic anhydrase family protein [Cyanobacteria bacterium P01_G01_bin.39]
MSASFNSSWSKPEFSNPAFIAANATVIGNVAVGEAASIWYGAVVRGDVERIAIGKYSNIQDGAVLHGDPGKPTIIEDYVTVGHRAVIHSAHIETGCLIGIGAIILDGVRVGANSIIGAGSVVTKDVTKRSLVMGVPARKVRDVSVQQVRELIEHAHNYAQLARVHAEKAIELGL